MLAPARAATALTLQVLLEPTRAARLARSGAPGFGAVTNGLLRATWYADPGGGQDAAIRRQASMQVLYGLLGLALDTGADTDVRAQAMAAVEELDGWLAKRSARDADLRSHYALARHEIRRLLDDPAALEAVDPVAVPPGSPIGSASE